MDINDIKDSQIVFLVGAPRSGTTYLQRLLATHPKIKTAQESHLFDNHIGYQFFHWDRLSTPFITGKRIGVGIPCYHTEESFTKILKEFSLKLLAPFLVELQPDEIFLEKTPYHSLYIKDIVRIFPDSKIIHLVRHPFDACRSYLHSTKTWFKGKMNILNAGTVVGSIWKNSVNGVLNNKYLIKKDNYLEIKYEDLLNNNAVKLKEILGFIGFEEDISTVKTYIQKNSKANQIKGEGGRIPIKGEIQKKTGCLFLNEPKGFINTNKYKVNPLTSLLIWRKVHKTGKILGYNVHYISFIIDANRK